MKLKLILEQHRQDDPDDAEVLTSMADTLRQVADELDDGMAQHGMTFRGGDWQLKKDGERMGMFPLGGDHDG